MKSNSWVISNKATGLVIFETYCKSVADRVNTEKYTVETAYDYLCRINREIKKTNGSSHSDL